MRPKVSWILELHGQPGNCITIGINGPRGIGKTTLTTQLAQALNAKGLRTIAISLDDFYLTRSDQVRLALHHQENSFLQQRALITSLPTTKPGSKSSLHSYSSFRLIT